MNHAYDQEFEVPPEKAHYTDPGAIPPTSSLAVVSLVFSILGVTALPFLGSIVGIATGHASMGQIRESKGLIGGRSMAKAGLILGYVPIILVLVGIAIASIFWTTTNSVSITSVIHESSRGAKMVNEMDREDYDLVEQSEIPLDGEKIIACYNAGRSNSDPEFALLTNRSIIYLKEGRETRFELTDVSEIKNDEAYEQAYNGLGSFHTQDFGVYHIEVMEKDGPRMRINIEPQIEGAAFFDALEKAWKAATEHAESVSH
ncbi:DUF4190 domain-containing protein [Tundrisphaera lichenicola]|uniref:DUF4190 domain-containing protein n=1 Tax=Tundrisphaera lichenicola TaxID=2029860 RepID=UPI003EC015D0